MPPTPSSKKAKNYKKEICAKFLNKPNSFKEIEKSTIKQTKRYIKMASSRGGHVVKTLFRAVSIVVIQKTFSQSFRRKILTNLNKEKSTPN